MAKRKLRVVQEHPLLGFCEYCNMQFSSGDGQLARSSVQQQFDAHECKLQDFAQNSVG